MSLPARVGQPATSDPNVKHILLVDDVCTTGATLTQCALALRSRGCEHVYAVTVAKAVGHEVTADI